MKDIQSYESMAKLDLPEAERQWVSARADELTESFAALEAIGMADVLPLVTVLGIRNILREDICVKIVSRGELLSGAPAQTDGYFQVPKTLV